MSYKGLTHFIKKIRACDGPTQEQELIKKEQHKIRKAFSNPKLTGYDRRKYLLKMIFMHVLGYSVDFGFVEALKAIGGEKPSDKVTGYVFFASILDDDSEFNDLLTHTLITDIQSGNPRSMALALNFVGNKATSTMAETLVPVIIGMSTNPPSGTPTICRKKALLCLLRLFRRAPDLMETDEVKGILLEYLKVRNVGVLTCLASVLVAFAANDPQGYLAARPHVTYLLKKIVIKNEVSDAQTYHGVACPWLLIKLMRLLIYLDPCSPETEPEEHNDTITCIQAIIQRTGKIMDEYERGMTVLKNGRGAIQGEKPTYEKLSRWNMTFAIFFESVNLALHIGYCPQLFISTKDSSTNSNSNDFRDSHTYIVPILLKLTRSIDPNIRFISLRSLAEITEFTDSYIKIEILKAKDDLEEILKSDDYPGTQRRALEVVYNAVTFGGIDENGPNPNESGDFDENKIANLTEQLQNTVSDMLDILKTKPDIELSVRQDVVLRTALIAERIVVINTDIKNGNGSVSRELYNFYCRSILAILEYSDIHTTTLLADRMITICETAVGAGIETCNAIYNVAMEYAEDILFRNEGLAEPDEEGKGGMEQQYAPLGRDSIIAKCCAFLIGECSNVVLNSSNAEMSFEMIEKLLEFIKKQLSSSRGETMTDEAQSKALRRVETSSLSVAITAMAKTAVNSKNMELVRRMREEILPEFMISEITEVQTRSVEFDSLLSFYQKTGNDLGLFAPNGSNKGVLSILKDKNIKINKQELRASEEQSKAKRNVVEGNVETINIRGENITIASTSNIYKLLSEHQPVIFQNSCIKCTFRRILASSSDGGFQVPVFQILFECLDETVDVTGLDVELSFVTASGESATSVTFNLLKDIERGTTLTHGSPQIMSFSLNVNGTFKSFPILVIKADNFDKKAIQLPITLVNSVPVMPQSVITLLTNPANISAFWTAHSNSEQRYSFKSVKYGSQLSTPLITKACERLMIPLLPFDPPTLVFSPVLVNTSDVNEITNSSTITIIRFVVHESTMLMSVRGNTVIGQMVCDLLRKLLE